MSDWYEKLNSHSTNNHEHYTYKYEHHTCAYMYHTYGLVKSYVHTYMQVHHIIYAFNSKCEM